MCLKYLNIVLNSLKGIIQQCCLHPPLLLLLLLLIPLLSRNNEDELSENIFIHKCYTVYDH